MTDKTKTPAQIKTEQAYEAIERTQKLNERIKAMTDNNKPAPYEQKLSCTSHPSQIRKRDKMRIDKETNAPQFTNKDLEKCGRTMIKTKDEQVFAVTADDLNLFLRTFSKKNSRKKTKKFDLNYNEETSEITLEGKIVAGWNNDANNDYPEDLIWSRDISRLFIDAVTAGYELGKLESQGAKLVDAMYRVLPDTTDERLFKILEEALIAYESEIK